MHHRGCGNGGIAEACYPAAGPREASHGKGLFAETEMEEGQAISEFTGEVIQKREWQKRERYRTERYTIELNEDLYLDATTHGGVARYSNHKCQGSNARMERWQVGDEYRIRLVAKHSIAVGEEITWDYTEGVWGVHDKARRKTAQQRAATLWFYCECGSGECVRQAGEPTLPASPRAAKVTRIRARQAEAGWQRTGVKRGNPEGDGDRKQPKKKHRNTA